MLERNGLITALDLHIWEEVFRALRAWVDAGQAPVPISVNVSRRDLYALDVLGTFEGLIEKYDIPPSSARRRNHRKRVRRGLRADRGHRRGFP